MIMSFMLASGLVLIPSVSASSSNTTGFQVINAAWGAASNSTTAGPGDRNVPLTVTLEYTFPNTAESVQGLLDLPTGFTLYNGSSVDFSTETQTMPTGTIFELTFNSIYLASNLALGSYSATLNLSWTAAGYAYVLNQTSTITLVVQGTPQIDFSSPSSTLISGEVNNISMSIQNTGSGSASNISISASSQIAGIVNSVPQILSLASGTSDTFMLQIYIPKSASGSVISLTVAASYKDPSGNSRSASQTFDFYGSSLSEPSLEFSVTPHSLSPGQVNNVTVTLTNAGSGTADSIITTMSGSSQSVSLVSNFPNVDSLAPGSSDSATVSIYVSSSAASSPLTLTFSASYFDQYGVAGSTGQSEGFQVAATTIANTSLSVTTISNSVISGSVSEVSFLVKNLGNSTIYSPTFAISVASPLVISGNSTFSSVGTSISPGASQVFTAYLTASLSSTSGVYSTTINVSFTDQYGMTHDQTYSVAVNLSGPVELVIQNEAFSQTANTITVTGSILNEGSSSAYYSAVSGILNGSTTGSPDYVGEIDPDSPVPFTATIPLQAEGGIVAGNITIFIQFKNSLGQTINSSSSETTQLKSISQILSSNSTTPSTTSQNGIFGLTVLEFLIIVIVVLVALGTGVVATVRRRQERRHLVASPSAGRVS